MMPGESTTMAAGQSAAALSTLLELRHISHSYGGVLAVDDASLRIAAGCITGLIGPNGAGKSTLLNIIAGSIRNRSGEILLGGQNIVTWPAHKRAKAGIARTFQLSSEFKRLTVIENMLCGVHLPRGERLAGALLGPRWWGGPQREAIDRGVEILTRFALDKKANELAGSLSGGERRLVEIARALMSRPRVLLLDEPLAGVHPRSAGRIIEAMRSLRDSGVAMVMCLHEPDAVRRACDSVAVMAQGSVIATGSFDEIRANNAVLGAYLGT